MGGVDIGRKDRGQQGELGRVHRGEDARRRWENGDGDGWLGELRVQLQGTC